MPGLDGVMLMARFALWPVAVVIAIGCTLLNYAIKFANRCMPPRVLRLRRAWPGQGTPGS